MTVGCLLQALSRLRKISYLPLLLMVLLNKIRLRYRQTRRRLVKQHDDYNTAGPVVPCTRTGHRMAQVNNLVDMLACHDHLTFHQLVVRFCEIYSNFITT